VAVVLFGPDLRQTGLSAIGDFWLVVAPKRFWAIWVGMILIVLIFVDVVVRAHAAKELMRHLLERFDLADALLHAHPLRQLYVTLFDPDYYGIRDMDDILARALSDDLRPGEWQGRDRLLRDYQAVQRQPPIHVTLAAADVGKGELTSVPEETKVVNGLLAATAIVPLFPAQAVDGTLFIDGTNIANEPTTVLINYLRKRVEPAATALHIYSTSPLPTSRTALEDDPPEHENLVDIAQRAMHLQRFRDATLERRLTEVHTRAIPADGLAYQADHRTYLRAWITPIEPDAPLQLNARVLKADKRERRRLIAEAVADGCRASLEVMVDRVAIGGTLPGQESVLPCRQAVHDHLSKRVLQLPADSELRDWVLRDIPGSKPEGGPGLPEVCEQCALRQRAHKEARDRGVAEDLVSPTPRSLVFRNWKEVGPPWPLEEEEETSTPESKTDPHFEPYRSSYDLQSRDSLRALGAAYTADRTMAPEQRRAGTPWPRDRETRRGDKRALVNLLFSGGVFRGVYQMGVLNALNEVRLRPDLVAGASVGSISAAMATRALTMDPTDPKRAALIARMCAAFLTIDELILTDRFADFVRSVTLRAAATRFSLRQADRLFRQYDASGAHRFNRDGRLTVAGIERLFYVSPFELLDLVEAIRGGKSDRLWSLLRDYSQKWLDRSGVGSEVLGAEPLGLLIDEYVVEPAALAVFGRSEDVPLDWFLAHDGVYFLCTTTNVTSGRLEILGEQQLLGGNRRAGLLEALLASSAFPGVFRPRAGWEIMRGSESRDQYIDGGVIDNLPLDAVAQFLHASAVSGLIEARPQTAAANGVSLGVPHLVFSASLETRTPRLSRRQLDALVGNWPALLKRAQQLRYNKKVELFAAAQRAVRSIWAERTSHAWSRPSPNDWTPLDLEVIAVQPNWLCGTFAFHPMMGFRRRRQAASIAHGCATTLLELGRLFSDPVRSQWAVAWGIRADDVPGNPPPRGDDPIVPSDNGPGVCHFRPGKACPFSGDALRRLAAQTPLRRELVSTLPLIYTLCGKAAVHRADYQ
jgi:predicted acylesterase/phospholipase RssA